MHQNASENKFDKELLASNLVGAKTLEELFAYEHNITAEKILELIINPIDGNYDYKHYKMLHKIIFEDIYNWAGLDRYELRYYGIFRKGDTEFTKGADIPYVAKKLFGALKDENYFKGLDKNAFIKSAASFLNGLNLLHPFREGNGRTQRLFMMMLSKQAGYELDFSSISKNINLNASILGAKGRVIGFEKIISMAIVKDN